MKKISEIPKYYDDIIRQLTLATDRQEVLKYEIQLLAMVLSPMIIIAAIVSIFLGLSWNIPVLNVFAFFTTMIASAAVTIYISHTNKPNQFKINIISAAFMIAILATFFTYYNRINLAFFFILVIITFFASLSSDRTLLIYIAATYGISYVLAITVFKTNSITVDPYFNVVLLCVLTFIIVASFVSNYLYRVVISQKITEYLKIKIQNDEILSLNRKLIERENRLIHQNEKLNLYNDEISSNKEKLEFLAYNDPLTGLPNRKKIMEQLEFLVEMNQGNEQPFAMVFIDLDNFKKVNDSLGHAAGDKLLINVTQRLTQLLHKKDIIGRLGGDELALVIPRRLTGEDLLSYVQSLCDLFDESFELGDNHLKVTASFGIAVWPDDGQNAADLLKAADTAMYKAKEFGKNNVQFYHEDMKREILLKIEMENRLIKALENNEFYLEYQPLFEGHSKSMSGFEALIRWETEEHQRINPVDFIPLAEEMGLINEIGEWVLHEACKKIREIKTIYGREIKIAVNISPIQMKSSDFVDRVKLIIEAEKIAPQNLELEITESIFIDNKDKAVEKLNALKQLGVKIAMDDFGTGYSSLSYLLELPIDKLKIDKSFIDVIQEDGKRTEIVGSIIEMVHCLDIQVVAEGVETQKQLQYLEDENCDLLQGYYLSRPLTELQMNEFLNNTLK